MTGRAGLAAAVLLDNRCVISASGGDASGNLSVAVEAFERCTAARPVTLRTIRGAFQAGVSAG